MAGPLPLRERVLLGLARWLQLAGVRLVNHVRERQDRRRRDRWRQVVGG